MGIFSGEKNAGFWAELDQLGGKRKKKFRKTVKWILRDFGCKCLELEAKVESLEEEMKKKEVYFEEVIKGLEKEVDLLKKTTFQGNSERVVHD